MSACHVDGERSSLGSLFEACPWCTSPLFRLYDVGLNRCQSCTSSDCEFCCVWMSACVSVSALQREACQICSCPPLKNLKKMRSVRVQLRKPEDQSRDSLDVSGCHGNTGSRFSASLSAIHFTGTVVILCKKGKLTKWWKISVHGDGCPRNTNAAQHLQLFFSCSCVWTETPSTALRSSIKNIDSVYLIAWLHRTIIPMGLYRVLLWA